MLLIEKLKTGDEFRSKKTVFHRSSGKNLHTVVTFLGLKEAKNPDGKISRLARVLYNDGIRPVETFYPEAQINHLLFSPDHGLYRKGKLVKRNEL